MGSAGEFVSSLGWRELWITLVALIGTPICYSAFFSKGTFALQPPFRRAIYANLTSTAFGLIFAFADHTHPRSPSIAYLLAALQCGLFVAATAGVGRAERGKTRRLE